MPAALHQGWLFEQAAPCLSPAACVERARGYVASVLRRRVCAGCCDEEGLAFVHQRQFPTVVDRRPHPANVPIARLVQVGAALADLRREMAKCDVWCPRCKARVLSRRRWTDYQMLGGAKKRSIGVVAKATITTGGRAKAPKNTQAKVARIVEGIRSAGVV